MSGSARPLTGSSPTRLGLPGLLGVLVLTALVAALGAAYVHHACFDPGPPVSRPDPGTSRGEYCSAIAPYRPWTSLIVAPVLVVAGVWLVSRRRAAVVWAFAVLLGTVLLVNAGVANSLEFALTI
jgi:hypothetical protein